MSYLDETGLSYFWGKIKSLVSSKMDKSTYDPQNKAQDVFGYVDSVAEGLIEYVDFTVTDVVSETEAVVVGNKTFDEVMALLKAGTTVIGRIVNTTEIGTFTTLLTAYDAFDSEETGTSTHIIFYNAASDPYTSFYQIVTMYAAQSVLRMYSSLHVPESDFESDNGKVLMSQFGTPVWSPMPTAGELGALPISGGTMTGPLTLSGDPTEDLQAAPTQYVDALKPKTITVTLPASGWSNNQQTVTATGVTANNAVTPSPAPASWEAAGAAGVRCMTQGGTRLTFTCSETPTEELTYNVLIQEVQ